DPITKPAARFGHLVLVGFSCIPDGPNHFYLGKRSPRLGRLIPSRIRGNEMTVNCGSKARLAVCRNSAAIRFPVGRVFLVRTVLHWVAANRSSSPNAFREH